MLPRDGVAFVDNPVCPTPLNPSFGLSVTETDFSLYQPFDPYVPDKETSHVGGTVSTLTVLLHLLTFPTLSFTYPYHV